MNSLVQLSDQPTGPRIERVRHELKRRSLQVQRTTYVTPGMLRIDFSGENLSDFVSLSADDHVKIFVPTPAGEVERRDYTPRRFDAQARTLAIDFAVHDAGPATQWALDARPGDTLEVGGPRGSAVVSPDVRSWLLIGDETALPAMGRRIEEASGGTHITMIAAVTGREEEQRFDTRADFTAHWCHRPLSAADDPDPLLAMARTVDIVPKTFIWVAAEAAVARAVRTCIVGERGHPLNWTKTAGYWVMGEADAHEKFE